MSLQRIIARRRHILRKAGGIGGAYPRKGFGSRSTLSETRTAQSQFSNTFQLEPDNRSRFNPHSLETIMKDILEQRLADRVYDAKTCSALSQELATAIKVRAKEFKWDRYKLIVDVIIGQNLGQCIEVASRFIPEHVHIENPPFPASYGQLCLVLNKDVITPAAMPPKLDGQASEFRVHTLILPDFPHTNEQEQIIEMLK